MNTKTEIKWIGGLLISMVLLAAIMTDFTFRDLEFQSHDVYFAIQPYHFVVYGAATLYTIKNLFLLVELITERYRIVALLISIINPLIAVFLIFILYLGVRSFLVFGDNYPEIGLAGRLLPLVALSALLIGQMIIEVRMLRKLRLILQ
ncbi:MAG TPA: hypothetical protein VFT90_00055 [Chryseosolibacter sp.]|nr:hypothetical protein [Chryseosolibacter sp.]